MKFNVQPFDDLEPHVLRRLSMLTNHASRGDVFDHGGGASSSFRESLDGRICGEEFPNSWAIIAREPGDDIVGWCMVTRHSNSPHSSPRYEGATASVGFYVRPDDRRSGLGSRLIQEARQVAQKIGVSRLVANPWNRRSNCFFEANGFRIVEGYTTGFRGVAYLDLSFGEGVSHAGVGA